MKTALLLLCRMKNKARASTVWMLHLPDIATLPVRWFQELQVNAKLTHFAVTTWLRRCEIAP